MLGRRWKPTGNFTPLEELRHGDHVQGFYDTYQRKQIKNGYIRIVNKPNSYSKNLLCELPNGDTIDLGYWYGTGEFSRRTRAQLYVSNGTKLKKERGKMGNKLMALVRLNKNGRRLQKVGIYDENGNLTEDGSEVLLNLIAKEYETKLVDLVKDWKENKKKDEED